MIKLTLLHPLQSTPIQSWVFEKESVVRVGRATDNHIILYSAVVSRHHLELRLDHGQWELINLGTNGTYVNGKRITRLGVSDGMVFRLARSGPHIQVTLHEKLVQPELSRSRSSLPRTVPHAVVEAAAPEGRISWGDDLPTQALAESACVHLQVSADGLVCLDCGQPLEVLQTIGNYQVIKILSQGNVGITYEAWRSQERFVLKTLNSNYWLRHPEVMEGFEREAKRRRQLHHPGLPYFVDLFSVGGQPYCVTEKVEGETLLDRMKVRGALPQDEVIPWLIQILEVLSYMHGFNPPILHGDIKAENIIVRRHPKENFAIALVDFGLVEGLVPDRDTWFTPKGFMPPEQRAGRALNVSDLYALGYTLTHLLTGQVPGSLYTYEDEGWRFCSEAVAGLPPDLAAIIHRLTHPQPDKRFYSAEQVAQVLLELAA